jgi:N,N-dimethylformamidase
MTVTGYATAESLRPGESIGFCLSQDSDEPVDFDLVRLIHGDLHADGPGLKETVIDHAANGRYEVALQTMHAGSSAVVENTDQLAVTSTWTVSALVCPTLPTGSAQAILGRYDASTHSGWVLHLDEGGRPTVTSGTGEAHGAVSLAEPLVRGCWYLVWACLDADSGSVTVGATPAVTSTNSRLRSVPALATASASAELPVAWSQPYPLRFAAVSDGERTAWHLNGKLERPRIIDGAVPLGGPDPVLNPDAIVAEWDFALQPSVTPASGDTVRELRGTGCTARLVNLPTRAVTGSAWDGTVHSHLAAPEHYAAVHFHDDDVGAANWDVTVEMVLPDDLPTGIYAGRCRDGTSEHYVVFYVRAPIGQESDVALLIPTFSYRAYANDHSPHDMPFAQMIIGHTPVLSRADVQLDEHREYGLGHYDTHSDGSGVSITDRRRPVLNLAPKSNYWLSSSTVWQFNADLHLVDWLTERGTRFDVVTDTDLHLEGSDALAPYRVVLTGSHPEYASGAMLDALETYLDGGGNMMYLGGNGYYWVTSLDPEDSNIMEVRRWGGSQAWKARPGEFHHATTGEMGGLWRNRARPPQQLVGVGFVAVGHDVSSPYRRIIDDTSPGAWVFEGTDVKRVTYSAITDW